VIIRGSPNSDGERHGGDTGRGQGRQRVEACLPTQPVFRGHAHLVEEKAAHRQRAEPEIGIGFADLQALDAARRDEGLGPALEAGEDQEGFGRLGEGDHAFHSRQEVAPFCVAVARKSPA
jgi:hypothetical protein